MMKRFILIVLWLVLVVVAARWVSNYRLESIYSELITESAAAVLAEQEQLNIAVFALPDSPAAKLVKNFLEPLLIHLPNAQIEYLDINNNAELADRYQVQKQGEMVISNNAGTFQLSTLSYEAFFNGLKRLQQEDESWLVFLEGLGSRSYSPTQLTGLSRWLQNLKEANYKSMVLPFDNQLKLPAQTRLLVLASPADTLTEADMAWLQQAIESGVAVLWLADPQTAVKQPALALLFDVMRTDAFHPEQLIIKDFNEHPINANFDRPIDLKGVLPFETGHSVLWLNDSDQAVAATQEIGMARLMVIGDSDFLSNAHLNSGGNLEMSYRLVDWLLHYENRLDLPTLGVTGTQLHYQRSEILWFSGIMLLLLPALFLMLAFYYWRKQK